MVTKARGAETGIMGALNARGIAVRERAMVERVYQLDGCDAAARWMHFCCIILRSFTRPFDHLHGFVWISALRWPFMV